MAAYPLEGYRVVDFSQVWAGPIVGHLLADMGAEVIHIESRAGTDQARMPETMNYSPVKLKLWNQWIFRNRLYCTLNLNKPRGAELAKALVQNCDIVVENYSPRVMANFGLDYAALSAVNPRLVMVSMSAAGQYGPYRDLLGYGPSIYSITGTDALCGYAGDDRLMVTIWDADATTACFATFAVLAALRHREQTGEGQYIDLSFWEALASLHGGTILDYTMNRRIARPRGNTHPTMAPYGIYPCAGEDKWVSIAVGTEAEWQAFCRALGEPPWTRAERFADLAGRLRHRAELDALVGRWTREHTPAEVTERLQAAGVAAVPVLNVQELYLDPHDQFRRADTRVEAPDLTPEDVLYGIPWKLSATPGAIRRVAGPLGRDNAYVLGQMLKLSADEIRRLEDEQVVY